MEFLKTKITIPKEEDNTPFFRTQGLNEAIIEGSKEPPLIPLGSDLWRQGEILILFADTGVGKTILALQHAEQLARGLNIFDDDKTTLDSKKVGFWDFEMTPQILYNRYCDGWGNRYQFSDNITRIDINPNFLAEMTEEHDNIIIDEIAQIVDLLALDVIIIDNITWLKSEANQDQKVAINLMRALWKLRRKKKISIMVVAHTPKRNRYAPLENADVSGSKNITNFADTVVGIGQVADTERVYVKHTKHRNIEGAKAYNNQRVLVCEKEKTMNGFLRLVPKGESSEMHLLRRKKSKEEIIEEIQDYRKDGLSVNEIVVKTGMPRSTVYKYLNIKSNEDDSE